MRSFEIDNFEDGKDIYSKSMNKIFKCSKSTGWAYREMGWTKYCDCSRSDIMDLFLVDDFEEYAEEAIWFKYVYRQNVSCGDNLRMWVLMDVITKASWDDFTKHDDKSYYCLISTEIVESFQNG